MNRPAARKYYEMALAADDQHQEALRALAVLDFEAARYGAAARRFEQALARKPNDDGRTWYYLGVCHFNREDYEAALRCGYQATRCFGTAGLGADLVGRALLRQGRITDAIPAFARASAVLPQDPIANDHYLIALCAAGRHEEARQAATQRIRENPTCLGPRAVLALRDQESMARFAADAHAYLGEVEFETIEVCLEFAELGLAGEAAKLLGAVCIDHVEPPARGPLAYYYLAYFSAAAGDQESARKYLTAAAQSYSRR